MTRGVRACGRATSNIGSCQSVQFPSNGVSYSQVVVGYQYVSPSGVSAGITNINTYYLDGISITHGSSRKHMWSFLAGFEEFQGSVFNCPCTTGSTQTIVQSFIGTDYMYFCESLWDGKGCDGAVQIMV